VSHLWIITAGADGPPIIQWIKALRKSGAISDPPKPQQTRAVAPPGVSRDCVLSCLYRSMVASTNTPVELAHGGPDSEVRSNKGLWTGPASAAHPEYQKVHEDSMADQAKGGQGAPAFCAFPAVKIRSTRPACIRRPIRSCGGSSRLRASYATQFSINISLLLVSSS
jgi:hypothetical protein